MPESRLLTPLPCRYKVSPKQIPAAFLEHLSLCGVVIYPIQIPIAHKPHYAQTDVAEHIGGADKDAEATLKQFSEALACAESFYLTMRTC